MLLKLFFSLLALPSLHTIETPLRHDGAAFRACVNWDECWVSVLESEVTEAEGKASEPVENETAAINEAKRQHGARRVGKGRGGEGARAGQPD